VTEQTRPAMSPDRQCLLDTVRRARGIQAAGDTGGTDVDALLTRLVDTLASWGVPTDENTGWAFLYLGNALLQAWLPMGDAQLTAACQFIGYAGEELITRSQVEAATS
jgi:hypothetical protein